MANNEKIVMDARTTVENSLLKLSFLSDAIKFWDTDCIALDTDMQYGFSLCMEDTIKEIEKSVEVLDRC